MQAGQLKSLRLPRRHVVLLEIITMSIDMGARQLKDGSTVFNVADEGVLAAYLFGLSHMGVVYASLMAALLSVSPAARAQSLDFSAQLAEGGIALVVTFGLSVLALAVVIERLLHLRKNKLMPDGLAEQARTLWAAGEFARLDDLLAQHDSTLARAIAYLLKHRHAGHAFASSGAGDLVSLELRRHQQKAYPLTIVATVAPIVGLLGTVIGMIEAFHVIAAADGMGNPALLAGGISKALVNTAAGLTVALPALGMHHFFRSRVIFFGLDLEQQINRLAQDWLVLPAPVMPHVVQGHAH